MVQLTEVEDEHFQHAQVGPDEDEEDFTDTGLFFPFPIPSPFPLRFRPPTCPR